MIGQGLIKNTTLKSLILKGNRIGDGGGEAIAKGIHLETVDLTSCSLGDTSALHLSNLITDSTAIRKLYLADNNLHDSAGSLLVEAVRKNANIQVIDVSQNPLNYRYQEDLMKHVTRNLFNQNLNRVPTFTK